LRAVWMVKSRQIAARLRWWLTLIGYDRRDRSLTHRIYLVYAALIWSVWIVAVLSLLAVPAAALLKTLRGTALNLAAAGVATMILLASGLYRLWQVTHRSPIVFSEEDAHLLCRAPVPGASVVLAWFLGDWIKTAGPFLAGALTLSIALVDSRLADKISPANLPAYASAGLQALVMVALVQIGITAFVWAAGTLRLQGDRRISWQPRAARWVIAITGLFLAYTLFPYNQVTAPGQGLWQAVRWLIELPLRAAFETAPFGAGFLAGGTWALLGLMALAWGGANLNLSRAAQETTQFAMIEKMLRYGQTEMVQQLTLQGRLGSGRRPASWPIRRGIWALVWKEILQSSRSFSLGGIWPWLVLFAVGLFAVLATDPPVHGLTLAVWSIMVGQRVTGGLQKNLGRWSLLRQLPFSSGELLIAILAPPWALTVVMGWGALAIAGGALPVLLRLQTALLLSCVSAGASLATAYDLLNNARTDMLLNGLPPQNSASSGLLSLLCLAIPTGVWLGLGVLNFDGSLPAMLTGIVLVLGFWRLASRRLQQMR